MLKTNSLNQLIDSFEASAADMAPACAKCQDMGRVLVIACEFVKTNFKNKTISLIAQLFVLFSEIFFTTELHEVYTELHGVGLSLGK